MHSHQLFVSISLRANHYSSGLILYFWHDHYSQGLQTTHNGECFFPNLYFDNFLPFVLTGHRYIVTAPVYNPIAYQIVCEFDITSRLLCWTLGGATTSTMPFT